MRKIIIAVVATALAGLTQAAGVNWGAANVPNNGSTSPTGYKAYLLYTAAGADTSSMMTSINSGNVSSIAAASSAVTTTFGKSKVAAQTSDVDGITNTSVNYDFYVVIVNSSTGTDYDQYLMASYANVGYSTLDSYYAVQALDMSSATWTDAPEPTSACLLLLGIAGLALKRKIA